MNTTIILFNNNGMSNAPEELSKTLIKNYLGLLKDEKKIPSAFLFYGDGVKLVCENSPVLDSLTALESRGVKLITCKTCLNYFEIFDKVKVGQIGTMADILTLQLEATKVITI